VATRVGGLADLYGSPDAVELTPAGDAEALGKNILWVLQDPAEAGRRVEQGRQTAARFTARAMADGYEALYQRGVGEMTRLVGHYYCAQRRTGLAWLPRQPARCRRRNRAGGQPFHRPNPGHRPRKGCSGDRTGLCGVRPAKTVCPGTGHRRLGDQYRCRRTAQSRVGSRDQGRAWLDHRR
jgi:hypothetical protein